MKFFILLILATTLAHSETVTIHSTHEEFIRLSDGRVYFWKQKTNTKFPENQVAELKVNNKTREIISLSPLYIQRTDSEEVNVSLPDDANPTIFRLERSVNKLFQSFRTDELKDSQCYDRGHIWAFEADKKQNIKLNKGWIFFADHFILKYRFYWWFHIAPLAVIKKDGRFQERILDKTFAKTPLTFKQWSDLFMENKPTCKDISIYTEFSLHPSEDDCYYMSSSRFVWQPRDLEEFANTGLLKNNYVPWEIQHAYKSAFGIDQ